MNEAAGHRDGVGQFPRRRADLASPDQEVSGRSWKLSQGAGPQHVDPGTLGFTLNRGLQPSLQRISA